MVSSRRSLRWIQIILTLFYGQVMSNSIYEYIVQGICGLILNFRPVYDSILLIVLGIYMLLFVTYAIIALWFCRFRMFTVALLILISIFILTLVKSVIEVKYIGYYSTRIEWAIIRTVELVFKLFGIGISLLFIIRLRQGFKPENL